jgi:hypothetical protein
MSEQVYQQLGGAGKLRSADYVKTYDATPIRGQSTQAAVAAAREWLVSQNEETDDRSSTRPASKDGQSRE